MHSPRIVVVACCSVTTSTYSPMCLIGALRSIFSFFFNDTATPEIYTLSLHDALPISMQRPARRTLPHADRLALVRDPHGVGRSEEHTSELQSQFHLVCRLLLEKKNLQVPYYPSISTVAFVGATIPTCSPTYLIGGLLT